MIELRDHQNKIIHLLNTNILKSPCIKFTTLNTTVYVRINIKILNSQNALALKFISETF